MIKLVNVTKFYRGFCAVDHVNLEVGKGVVFGFLGPNGAGKTTTIKMMAGVLKPTEGQIIINGIDLSEDPSEAKRCTGFIPDRPFLYEKLTGEEFLRFTAGLYRSNHSSSLETDIRTLLERFELSHWGAELIESYSHGMKQKLGIIQALQHDPELIIMDEPTEGLDPLNKVVLYDYLKMFRDQGKTIFFSSHDLSEVEKICDRIGLVRSGELIALEHISDLKKKMVRRMEIYFKGAYNPADFKSPNIQIIDQQTNRLILTIKGDINSVLRALAKYDINNLIFPEPSLEETFMQFYMN